MNRTISHKFDVDNKLRLRRSNSKSDVESNFSRSQDVEFLSKRKSQETKNSATAESKTPEKSEKDDSLADFKSPKEDTSSQEFKSTRTIPSRSRKRITSSSRPSQKSNTRSSKNSRRKKVASDRKQPSIESSFFKPNNDNLKTARVCPVCFKQFKDEDLHTAHMKSCAAKNQLSTKQLLDAVELQERQAEERKTLGLLAAPVLAEKKKSTPRSTTLIPPEDPDLELALAISKSLHEVQQVEELRDAGILSQESRRLVSNLDDDTKGPLVKFGFTTNKAAGEVLNSRSRRRKLLGPTALQTRSQSERERMISEKIAEVLMENEQVTQIYNGEGGARGKAKCTFLKSRFLRALHCTEGRLWDRTGLSPTSRNFYVKDLETHIEPKEVQIYETEVNLDRMEVDNYFLEKKKKDLEAKQASKKAKKITKSGKSPVSTNKTTDDLSKEVDFTKSVISDLSNALNNSAASDVVVFVKNDCYIWTHRLIFFIRCSEMLNDIVANDDTKFPNVKEKIVWEDVNYQTAFAFLEFIYCGVITKFHCIFSDDNDLTGLRCLARKYRVKDLFTYVRQEQSKISSSRVESRRSSAELGEIEEKGFDSTKEFSKLPDLPENFEPEGEKTSPSCPKTCDSPGTPMDVGNSVGRRSISPDIFEDSYVSPKINESGKVEIEINDAADENLNVLLDLLEQDSQVIGQSNENEPEVEEITSPNVSKGKGTSVLNNSSGKSPGYSEKLEISSPKFEKEANSLPKPKSNLSIFLEKVQRENAKSFLHVDSEAESSFEMTKPRNPFKISQSEGYHPCGGSPGDAMGSKERRSGLGRLEERIREEAARDPRAFNLTSYKSDETLPPRTSSTTSETEGRSLGNLDSRVMETDTDDEIFHQVELQPGNIETPERDSGVLNTETDEENLSMYSRYKKTHSDNSINEYRAALKNCLLRRSRTMEETSKPARSGTFSSGSGGETREASTESVADVFDLTDVESELQDDEETVTTQKTVGTRRNEPPDPPFKREFIGQDSDTECEDNKDEDEGERSGTTDAQEAETDIDEDIPLRSTQVSRTPLISLTSDEECTLDNDIAPTEEPSKDSPEEGQSSGLRRNRSRNLPDSCSATYNEAPKAGESRAISPIVICSSPGSVNDDFDLALRSSQKSIEKSDVSSTVSHSRNGSKRISEKAGTPDRAITDLEDSFGSMFPALPRFDETAKKQSRVPSDPKSSDGRIGPNGSSSTSIRRAKSFEEGSTSGRASIRKTTSFAAGGSTDPVDFNCMESPDLHKELRKYGFKPQKRQRARKLLQRIYEELHPKVATISSSSEDEGPPQKKANSRENEKNKLQEEDDDYEGDCDIPLSQNCNISSKDSGELIPEEMEYNDNDALSVKDSQSKIGDAFVELINANPELYKTILLYEPVEIESIHSMLKSQGFKCNRNVLMDFLDEQCITFRAQNQGNRHQRRKGKKKAEDGDVQKNIEG